MVGKVCMNERREELLLELPNGLKSPETKRDFEKHLLQQWVLRIGQNQTSELRDPIINGDRFVELLLQAQEEQRELVFVAIGCQDWIKIDSSDSNQVMGMGKLSLSNKRVSRFVDEVADFSKALSSFKIKHRICFSLSDIEALLHMELGNMGATIVNHDRQLLIDNVFLLANAIQEKGGIIQPFIHSELLLEITQAHSLREFQTIIAGENPTYRAFLDNEYPFDLQNTPLALMKSENTGPIWLDIQSFNFRDEVDSFADAARKVAPDMPLLSIFPNAGNWKGGQKPKGTFPPREELLASLIGLDMTPDNLDQWVAKLRKAKNIPLEQIINGIFNNEFAIASVEEKILAVRIICLLGFGFDPLVPERQANA